MQILYPLQLLNESSMCVLRRSIDTLVQYHRDTPLVDDCSDQTISQCIQYILNTGNVLLSNMSAYNQVPAVPINGSLPYWLASLESSESAIRCRMLGGMQF